MDKYWLSRDGGKIVRIITKHENLKRGCEYCEETLDLEDLGASRKTEIMMKKERIKDMREKGYLVESYEELYCSHGKCPYIELDTCSNYRAEADISHVNVARKERLF